MILLADRVGGQKDGGQGALGGQPHQRRHRARMPVQRLHDEVEPALVRSWTTDADSADGIKLEPASGPVALCRRAGELVAAWTAIALGVAMLIGLAL